MTLPTASRQIPNLNALQVVNVTEVNFRGNTQWPLREGKGSFIMVSQNYIINLGHMVVRPHSEDRLVSFAGISILFRPNR